MERISTSFVPVWDTLIEATPSFGMIGIPCTKCRGKSHVQVIAGMALAAQQQDFDFARTTDGSGPKLPRWFCGMATSTLKWLGMEPPTE